MTIQESIRLMKTLGDTTRLLILNTLLEQDAYVEIMAEKLNLAPSTVSFHLKKLEQASLVSRRKEQYYAVFTVNTNLLDARLKELITFENPGRTLQQEREHQYKKKILGIYTENGRISRIPTQHKKRKIVFELILAEFEPGKTYTEKEVNTIISRFHPDYCEIRRFFIDQGIMERSSQQYRLIGSSEKQAPQTA